MQWAEVPDASLVRVRTLLRLPLAAVFTLACIPLQGCDPKPEFVFVLEAPQTVELAASASSRSVGIGTPVVLYAERTTEGSWSRIPYRELKPDQCWMAAIPPQREAAVADNLHWIVEPANVATFNTDFRSDHTRTVVLSKQGIYTFTPSTAVWCEAGRSVAATPLRIEVHSR